MGKFKEDIMSDESTLPQGFFLKPPHEKAPDWVKGQIGIKVEIGRAHV